MCHRLRLAAALALIAGCGPTPPTITERSALKGHSREIVSIAISPDGKTLASRGADAVKVWDLAGGAEVASFPTDGSDFASVAFAPDGATLATDRGGMGAVAWDVASGRERVSYVFPPGKPSPLNGSNGAGGGSLIRPTARSWPGAGATGAKMASSPSGKRPTAGRPSWPRSAGRSRRSRIRPTARRSPPGAWTASSCSGTRRPAESDSRSMRIGLIWPRSSSRPTAGSSPRPMRRGGSSSGTSPPAGRPAC